MLESVLIKNYKATSLKRDSNTGIRTAASIKCYFDTINLKQSYFCTTYSFKILVSERNIKIISKIVNLKKKKEITILIYCIRYLCSILPRNAVILPRFEKEKSVFFKSVLSSRSENTAPVTRSF